jgi:hypothetical protein
MKSFATIVRHRGVLLACSLGAWAVGGCGSTGGSSGAGEADGTLGVALSVPGGVVIDQVSYVIKGPAGFTTKGTLDVSSAPVVSGVIGGIPAGAGYAIALSATSIDQSATCAGSAPFAVTAGRTTPVSVTIDCHAASTNGSVAVQAGINTCPVIDGLSASPSTVFLGASLSLSATAHDPDAGPAPLAYAWTASTGTLAGNAGASPTFTCTMPGQAAVTVTVSDGDASCNVSQAVDVTCLSDASSTFYTTKTPYVSMQDPSTYEAPPAGFSTVFTEIVARHGARGLTAVKYDGAAYNMWNKASQLGALTPLGAALGPDILAIMKANALLGDGVPGITAPGYGNLTLLGISEQQQLAARLLQRQAAYFATVAAGTGSSSPRTIPVVSSGVDRAVDSAAFFSGSIATNDPALAPLLTQPPAPVGYPANAPVIQPAGTNRFLLYFHKLVAKTDLVTNPADPYFQTYQDSQTFQAYATAADLTAKINAVLTTASATAAARAVLEGLFTEDFVNGIDNGTYSFTNAGTFSFTSNDGQFSATVTGDGKTTVKSLSDAASMLYNLYTVVPAMASELPGLDFTKYIPAVQARTLAYLQDAQDFYNMGPGITEDNPVTYKMAQVLLNDFFDEVDAIEQGNMAHAAKLRFTHAEIICPFASILGLKGAFVQVPDANTYTYDNNPWRGELVSPMAANVQWDIVSNGAGALLVKMFYNEKEIDFMGACDGARHAVGSHYYDYDKLAVCYGHTR